MVPRKRRMRYRKRLQQRQLKRRQRCWMWVVVDGGHNVERPRQIGRGLALQVAFERVLERHNFYAQNYSASSAESREMGIGRDRRCFFVMHSWRHTVASTAGTVEMTSHIGHDHWC
jgi:hypothetical protein